MKIEDRHALENVQASVGVPGIAFAEWGPGDMGLSLNAPSQTAPEMVAARSPVLAATRNAGISFLNQVDADNVERMIDEGVRIGAGANAQVADRGRRYTKQRMPW